MEKLSEKILVWDMVAGWIEVLDLLVMCDARIGNGKCHLNQRTIFDGMNTGGSKTGLFGYHAPSVISGISHESAIY